MKYLVKIEENAIHHVVVEVSDGPDMADRAFKKASANRNDGTVVHKDIHAWDILELPETAVPTTVSFDTVLGVLLHVMSNGSIPDLTTALAMAMFNNNNKSAITNVRDAVVTRLSAGEDAIDIVKDLTEREVLSFQALADKPDLDDFLFPKG